ncbi:hypothetical protein M8745_18610 [Lutimaribacter sp. EGI FJ00014]|nr:hypothetical protein [Lutimaribacter sp. EGI FJ00014]
MTNALEAQFGNITDLQQRIADSERSIQENEQKGFVLYAKFYSRDLPDCRSVWTYGRPEKAIHPDSLWVVDVSKMRHGFMGFAPGADGRPVKGRQPDQVWTTCFDAFPERPAGKHNNVAYQFQAKCIESPNQDDIGVVISVTDHRKMKRGYAELESAVRKRVMAGELERPFPVIQFRAEMNVRIEGVGKMNRSIIHQLPGEEGWAGPIKEVKAKPITRRQRRQ